MTARLDTSLCPECKNKMAVVSVRCGIALLRDFETHKLTKKGGIYIYMLCSCGFTCMRDWATGTGIYGWCNLTDTIPIGEIK